jgi:ribonuclease HII
MRETSRRSNGSPGPAGTGPPATADSPLAPPARRSGHANRTSAAAVGRRAIPRATDPTLRYERELWRAGLVRVAGVDEVGVAPASGPVLAAAVIMAPNCRRIPGVRDSKTLSPHQREQLYPVILRRAVAVGVGAASVAEIDALNIYRATHLAMRRAIRRLGGHEHVLVDGLRIRDFEAHVGPYDAIVDGDALCYSIACASIVAKVTRDRLMARLAARHPGYGWERNAGYATREHRAAMTQLGITAFHRRSFITTQRVVFGEQQTLDLGERQTPARGLLPALATGG